MKIGTELKGVPFFFPKQIKREYVLTKVNLKSGELSPKCEQVNGEEYVTVPNYGEVFVIRQNSFILGQSKLGVTLEKGMLTAVNAEQGVLAASASGSKKMAG